MRPPNSEPPAQSGDWVATAEKNQKDDDLIAKGLGFTVMAITLLLVGAAVVVGFFSDIPQSFKDIKKFSEIGDFVGGILNPVISGCTLFIAYAVWKLQKAELAETRKELQESRKVMQEQTKIAEQQRSEQRFFDILKIYNTFLDQIKYSSTVVMRTESTVLNYTGKEALSQILLKTLDEKTKWSCMNYMNAYGISGAINYLAGDKNFQSYCNTVFSLLDYCFQNKIESSYISLFSSQLTRDEFIVISIYSMINKNYHKETLVNLDREINLFSNMNDDHFLKVIQTYLSSDTSLLGEK